MATLIERLSARAHDPAQATDDGGTVAAPPATQTQVGHAEMELTFRLPALLRQVYLEVGNGGFGPGAGLPGLAASQADAPGSLVGRYAALRKAQKAPPWPAGLVPLCEWGSGIASLLDCTRPEAPVIRLDPNMGKSDVAVRVPVGMRYDRAASVADACWVEAASLEEWLGAWADGKRLFYLGYGGADTEADAEEEDDAEDEGE